MKRFRGAEEREMRGGGTCCGSCSPSRHPGLRVPSAGTWAMSADVLVVTTWRGRGEGVLLPASSGSKAGILLSILQCTERPPQRSTWPRCQQWRKRQTLSEDVPSAHSSESHHSAFYKPRLQRRDPHCPKGHCRACGVSRTPRRSRSSR